MSANGWRSACPRSAKQLLERCQSMAELFVAGRDAPVWSDSRQLSGLTASVSNAAQQTVCGHTGSKPRCAASASRNILKLLRNWHISTCVCYIHVFHLNRYVHVFLHLYRIYNYTTTLAHTLPIDPTQVKMWSLSSNSCDVSPGGASTRWKEDPNGYRY